MEYTPVEQKEDKKKKHENDPMETTPNLSCLSWFKVFSPRLLGSRVKLAVQLMEREKRASNELHLLVSTCSIKTCKQAVT